MTDLLKTWHEASWRWFTEHADRPHALGWLALISFADALFFPIAPELFLGALILAHPNRWRSYLAAAAIPSALGAAAGYFIAVFLFNQFGEPILAFYHLQGAFDTARHIISGHVFGAMVVASFTPIPDKVFIYAGGFLGVPFFPFIVGYVLGRTARMGLVVYLVHQYGKEVLELIQKYLIWFGVAVLALGIIYGMVHWHLFGL